MIKREVYIFLGQINPEIFFHIISGGDKYHLVIDEDHCIFAEDHQLF